MIGRTVAHYRVEEKLGSGGMGVVYRGTDVRLGRPVALKFLPPQLGADTRAKQRFMQEARAASALDHANICTIFDIGETDEGEVFIVMAYYQGQTLKYLLEDGPLAIDTSVSIASQIAAGLAVSHGAGIVHRDVKPANIMVTERDEVKILDFGVAKLAESGELTREGSTVGTTSYMPPEQARGESVDASADVWSLGVILYEMLAGRRPFAGPYESAVLYAIVNEEPPRIESLRPEVSPELAALVHACLAKDPRERPATMTALRAALVGEAPSGVRKAATLPNSSTGPVPASGTIPATGATAASGAIPAVGSTIAGIQSPTSTSGSGVAASAAAASAGPSPAHAIGDRTTDASANTPVGEPGTGGNVDGGNTVGGNTVGGNTVGGNTVGGNTVGGTADAGIPSLMARFTLVAAVALVLVWSAMMKFGLPDWVFPIGVSLLLVGYPALFIAAFYERRRGAMDSGERRSLSGLSGWLSVRRAMIGGVLSMGGLALVAMVWMGMRALGIGPAGTLVSTGALEAESALVIADFDNRTSDPSLGPSLTEAFRIDLTQSRVIRVLDGATIADARERMQRNDGSPLDATLARDIAQREGAKAIVVGDVGSLGAGFVLSARLLSASDGAELVAVRETADDDRGLIAAVDRLSGTLRERIGESLVTIRGGAPLPRVTTTSLEALRLYAEAVRATELGRDIEAVPLLREAVQIDTSFAMAWRKLGVVLGNARDSYSDQIDAITRAYRMRDRLPEREAHLATASYFSNVEYDPPRAMAEYDAMLRSDPRDTYALNNMAVELSDLRRFAEAEVYARRAVEEEEIYNHLMNLARALDGQGRVAEARDAFARLVEVYPDNLRLRSLLLAAEAETAGDELADLDSVRALIPPSPTDPDFTGVRSMEANVLMAKGRLQEAIAARMSASAAEFVRTPNDGGEIWSLAFLAADIFQHTGDGQAADRIVEEALAKHPLESIDPLDRPYVALIYYWSVRGDVAKAEALLAEFRRVVPEQFTIGFSVYSVAKGVLALAADRPEEALSEFDKAWDDSSCPVCALHFYRASAEEALGDNEAAIASLERFVDTRSTNRVASSWGLGTLALWRLGDLYVTAGRNDDAVRVLTRFVDLWDQADPVLQPRVAEARSRIAELTARLSQEPGS